MAGSVNPHDNQGITPEHLQTFGGGILGKIDDVLADPSNPEAEARMFEELVEVDRAEDQAQGYMAANVSYDLSKVWRHKNRHFKS